MSPGEVLAAIAFTFFGFILGKYSTSKSSLLKSTGSAEQAAAYKELFDAFRLADSSLLKASVEEGLEGELTEELKQSTWDSLNNISHVAAKIRFLLPQDVIDVLDSSNLGDLHMSWGESLQDCRRIRDEIYRLVREDFNNINAKL